jgi:hypothetical protein
MTTFAKDSSSNTSFVVVIAVSVIALVFGAAVHAVSMRGDLTNQTVTSIVAE